MHSYYAQQAFMREIQVRNEETMEAINKEQDDLGTWRAEKLQNETRAKFMDDCTGRHHRTSTFVQPGVYNSPYAPFLDGIPTFEGIPIEEHLHEVMRVNGSLRTPPVTKTRPEQQYSKTGLSVQVSRVVQKAVKVVVRST